MTAVQVGHMCYTAAIESYGYLVYVHRLRYAREDWAFAVHGDLLNNGGNPIAHTHFPIPNS